MTALEPRDAVIRALARWVLDDIERDAQNAERLRKALELWDAEALFPGRQKTATRLYGKIYDAGKALEAAKAQSALERAVAADGDYLPGQPRPAGPVPPEPPGRFVAPMHTRCGSLMIVEEPRRSVWKSWAWVWGGGE